MWLQGPGEKMLLGVHWMLLITFSTSAYRILNTEQGLGLGLSIVLEERNIFPIEESLLPQQFKFWELYKLLPRQGSRILIEGWGYSTHSQIVWQQRSL